jgi:hypothetical protein
MRMGVGGLIADALIVLEKKRRRKIKDSMISLKEDLRNLWIYTPVLVQRVTPRRSSGKF